MPLVSKLTASQRQWLALALFCIMLVILQSFKAALQFDRSLIDSGEWWRVITGQWVHSNAWHVLMNGAGFVLLFYLLPRCSHFGTQLWRTLCLSALVGLGLWWFAPNLFVYVGLSGALYGLYWLTALTAVWPIKQEWRNTKNATDDAVMAWAIIALVPCKIIWDSIDPSLNNHSAALIGVRVATEAHIIGLGSAICYALALYARQWPKRRRA